MLCFGKEIFDGDGRGKEREGEKEEGDSWRDFYGNNYGLIVDAWIFFSALELEIDYFFSLKVL